MDKLLAYAQHIGKQVSTKPYLSVENRIAYVVTHAVTYSSNGYAVRTHGIARALKQHGLDVLCFLRPGTPWDLPGSPPFTNLESVIDGVRYVHSRWSKNIAPVGELNIFNAAIDKYRELFSVYRPSSVVAASNWVVGLPAWVAAKQLKLPFYYEVRGFWELSRDARETGYAKTATFKQDVERDLFVAQQALKVFTLNKPMRKELVKRGVKADRIDLVPNGVSELPKLNNPDPDLMRKLGIEPDEKVIGYVGSFSPYEGLDLLINACKDLVDQGDNIKLLLVGDDQPITSFLSPVKLKLRLEHALPWLIQVERVPHDQVASYYALIDVIVIPRKPFAVCELVPPMKVVEALAYSKRLVLSDVKPLKEYARESADVVFFEAGKSDSLAKAIHRSINSLIYQPNSVSLVSTNPQIVLNVSRMRCCLLVQSGSLTRSRMAARCRSKHKGETRVSIKFDKKELLDKKSVETDCDVKSEKMEKLHSDLSAVAKTLHGVELKEVSAGISKPDLCVSYSSGHQVKINQLYTLNKGIIKSLGRINKNYLHFLRAYLEGCQMVSGTTKFPRTLSKSVYFLHSSLPYLSGGYATRAHGLASALIQRGLDLKVYTRPNFPYDVRKGILEKDAFIQIDNVGYHKTTCNSNRLSDEASYMVDCIQVFDAVIKTERPGYVHGRSTYQIALPALIAAKRNGLPFVYEVSGLWELVHESRGEAYAKEKDTWKMRLFETITAQGADLVFTLTNAMKDELINRGVDGDKISILPNCTDTNIFSPHPKSKKLLDELGIKPDIPIIGYVGSFQDYEGLDDLIEACELLSQRFSEKDYKLLLVGDGPFYKEICARIQSSCIKDKILITGRIPHNLVHDYYSIIDIAPFPRKAWQVCEVVSPMKPLEAMAMEKAVLVSSVKALSEMIINNVTGLVFKKGSVESLCSSLHVLIESPKLRESLGKSARSWVIQNRTWDQISNAFITMTKFKQ